MAKFMKVREAQLSFSKIIRDSHQEDIIIVNASVPVAKISALTAEEFKKYRSECINNFSKKKKSV